MTNAKSLPSDRAHSIQSAIFIPRCWELPGHYLCTPESNLYTKRCEQQKRREETGEKTKFSALYTPSPGFENI